MKRALLVLGTAIALVALPGTVLADQGGGNGGGGNGGGQNDNHGQVTTFVTDMNGTLEVPSVATQATGEVVLRVSEDGTVRYRVSLENIHGVFASHIHAPSPPGGNAGVVQFLCAGAGVPVRAGTPACTDGGFSGTFKMTPMLLKMLLKQIRTGVAYVNVHTPANPGGEIRGWLASEDNGGNNGGNN